MSNITITRETAICMFFGQAYEPYLAYYYLNLLDGPLPLQICYEYGTPNVPILLSEHTINSDPTKYKLYPRVKDFPPYKDTVVILN